MRDVDQIVQKLERSMKMKRDYELEAISNQLRPICNPEVHMTGMDKVKPRRITPLALNIINLESQVRRNPFRLDGTEVIANDLRFRELFSDINSPDASAGPKVEDTLRIFHRS